MALNKRAILSALPNVVDGGVAVTGQGGLEAAGGNHTDQRPSFVTSIATQTPRASSFGAFGREAGSVDVVEIVNHNLGTRRPSYWRCFVDKYLRGESNPATNYLEELYPTNVFNGSNHLGDEDDVADDPWAGGLGDFMTAAAAGAWWAILQFDTPAAALSTVGNDHLFVIAASTTGVPTTGTLTVKLYESGSAVATLLNAQPLQFQDENGRGLFILPWSTSQLTTASGANVEIYVEGSSDLVRVYSILWVAGLDSDAEDSGWLLAHVPPASATFGSISATAVGQRPMASEFHLIDTPVTFAPDELPKVVATVANSTPGVGNQVGVLVAGKAYQPHLDLGSLSWWVEDPSTKGKTLGGQNVGANRRRRRVFRFELTDVSNADLLELGERIDWRKGILGAFSVHLLPQNEHLRNLLGAWVTLRETNEWEAYNASDGQDAESAIRWRRAFVVEEML